MGVGSYEANNTRFASGSGEQIVKHFEETLLGMKNMDRPSVCLMCGQENVHWGTLSSPGATEISGGHYYLVDDLVEYAGTKAGQRIIRGNTCIDLNGHTAGNSATDFGRAFYVVGNITLRMMNGTVEGRGSSTGQYGGVIYMGEGSSLYLQNVNVKRQICDGQTNIYGGAICAKKGCTIDISGGSVTGGQATEAGGNIYAETNSKLYLNNCSVTGGAINNATSTGYGGGIYSKGTVTLLGGSITGNTAADGAGVYMDDSAAQLILSGNANVTGNYMTDGTTANNIRATSSQLTISGTYTGTAGITVSSPSVGKVVGISDNANIAGANLTLDGVAGYTVAADGAQLKVAQIGAPVIKDDNGNGYPSIEQAVQNASAGSVLALVDDVTDNITLEKDAAIDLAGFSITGTVTYVNDAKLILSDSNTADYTVEDGKGYGTVPYTANVVAAAKHLLHVENGKASAHAYDVRLTTVNQRARVTGMYYTSCFQGDEVVKDNIEEFGISLRANKAPDDAYILADTNYKTHTGLSKDLWVIGQNPDDFYGTVLEGILLPTNGESFNRRNANTSVYSVPYIKLTNGSFLYGAVYSCSLRELTEQADKLTLDEDQLEGLVNMYDQYKSIMDEWDIPQIKKAYESYSSEAN